jgi:hypothetical protein
MDVQPVMIGSTEHCGVKASTGWRRELGGCLLGQMGRSSGLTLVSVSLSKRCFLCFLSALR